MYLNIMGHRSFNDLTQYPVFPWVIADYSSPTLGTSSVVLAVLPSATNLPYCSLTKPALERCL